MRKRRRIRIGSRGSDLALSQTKIVIDLLSGLHAGLEFETKIIRTAGDRARTVAALNRIMRAADGQGVFVKEIDRALLRRKIDLGVHSMKDVPTRIEDGLVVGAVIERGTPNDIFVGRTVDAIDRLPGGSTIGTSSPRRRAQIRNAFPHLKVVELRGNLDTRMKKLMDRRGMLDGIIVAAAAFKRLYRDNGIPVQALPLDLFTPAPAQGTICIICREGDKVILPLITKINDEKTQTEVAAERALLKRMEAGCSVPLGAYAELQDSELLHLRAMVASTTDGRCVMAEATGNAEEPDAVAAAVEIMLKSRGAERILLELRSSTPRVRSRSTSHSHIGNRRRTARRTKRSRRR